MTTWSYPFKIVKSYPRDWGQKDGDSARVKLQLIYLAFPHIGSTYFTKIHIHTNISLGYGKQKFQSIAATDLAYYLVGILDDSRTYAFDVEGDEILTIPEMTDVVAEILRNLHPWKIYIPVSMLLFFSDIIEKMSRMPKDSSMKSFIDGSKDDGHRKTAPTIFFIIITHSYCTIH